MVGSLLKLGLVVAAVAAASMLVGSQLGMIVLGQGMGLPILL